MAVHRDVCAGLDTGEIQEDRPPLPAVWHRESPVVNGGREDLRQRGRLRIPRAELVRMVHVDGYAESLHFPVPRHMDPVPVSTRFVVSSFSSVISSGAEKSLHLVVIIEVLEIPRSVQVHVVLALAETLGEGVGTAGEPDGFGASGLRVHVRHGCILPVRQVLGYGNGREEQGNQYLYIFHNQ